MWIPGDGICSENDKTYKFETYNDLIEKTFITTEFSLNPKLFLKDNNIVLPDVKMNNTILYAR